MKTKHSVKLLASSVVALTLLTGCGGGGGGRPSVDELSTSFQGEDNVLGTTFTETQADCIAEAFEGSDVSDETLRAMVDNDQEYEGSSDDQQALTDISTSSLAECMAG